MQEQAKKGVIKWDASMRLALLTSVGIMLMLSTTGCVQKMNNMYSSFLGLALRLVTYSGVILLVAFLARGVWEIVIGERQASGIEILLRSVTIGVLIAVALVSDSVIQFVVDSVGSVSVNPPSIPGLPGGQ